MKKLYLALIMIVVASSVSASSLPEFPFVFAEGRAEVEHEPNKARVSFRLKAFDPTASKALATVRTRSKELLAFFSKQKIKKEDIEAYEIDKDIVRERKDYSEFKILGYEVTRRFSITLHNLESYEPFAKKLMQMENVEKIHTVFGRTDRKQIEAKLVLKASADAKEQAQRMAEGFGKELGDVFAISQHGFYSFPAAFGLQGGSYKGRVLDMASGGRPDDNDFLFVPSTIKFETKVTALFKLKD